MKLRQIPEDFKVEEIGASVTKESGKYKLYLLEKRGMEAFYLLAYLAKQNGIPVEEIGIAGLKDKHAITKQYLTIPAERDIKTLHEQKFDLEFLGYVDERLEIGSLQGNKFEIVARDVKKGEIEGIYHKAKGIEKSGVPNYFDSQRFGSVIHNNFIVKYVVKGDYENAIKSFLTLYMKTEPARVKNEKRLILQKWPNLEGIQLNTKGLAGVVDEYNRTEDWQKAYRKIPTNIRKMFLSAYQSYLWNECVKLLLKKTLKHNEIYGIRYLVGELIFYKNLSEKDFAKIPETLKLIGPRMQMTELEKRIIGKVLSKEGLSLKDLDIQDETSDFFGVRERPVIIRPKDFKISEPMVDELNDRGKKNTFKITLSFELPKGSYATIVTKRIFNR